jgi:parallel beta-helix repeat protein
MFNLNSSPTVTDCTFEGNDADGEGGGMYNDGSSPTVTNCTFSGNTAEWGGGMYNINSSLTVTNCTFSGNTATNNRGGGMLNDSSSPTVSKCSFLNNNAVNYPGSGMSNYNSSSPIVTNCLFYKNYAYTVGGQEMSNEGNSSPKVTNCTFLTISDWAIYNANSSPTVTNCILWGAFLDTIWDDPLTTSSSVVTYTNVPPGGFTPDATNIYADPMFVDEANGDLHLKPSSPCIDAGDNSAPYLPATDIDGNDRIINDIVDMGAYEFAE